MTLTESIAYWTVRCIRSPLVDTAIEIEIMISIRIVIRIEVAIEVVIAIEGAIVIAIEIVIVMHHLAASSSKPFHWLLSMLTLGSGCDPGSSHLTCCR
jgi:hypothetical protein